MLCDSVSYGGGVVVHAGCDSVSYGEGVVVRFVNIS